MRLVTRTTIHHHVEACHDAHSTAITNGNRTEIESVPKSSVDYSEINQGFRVHVAVRSSWRSKSDSSLSLVHDEGNNNIGQITIQGKAKEDRG
jgi:hypothetical protein